MPDTPNPAHPEPVEGPTTLPAFTPVPRAKDRSNGWKPQVQRKFIEALAATGSVKAACRRVGRASRGAYLLRLHPEGAEFAAAWEVALDLGVSRIEEAAMDRALYGVEVPVLSSGKHFGTRPVHNERLVMFILRSRRPGKYAEGRARGLSALDKAELERLKKQWHQEWLAQDQEDEQETFASIDRFLDNMRTNRLANMSPAVRKWEIAAKAQAKADDAAGWGPGLAYAPYAEAAAELLDGFVKEVEADWPPLVEPEPLDDEDEACAEPLPLPPPAAAEPEEPKGGPRIRTLKDDGW